MCWTDMQLYAYWILFFVELHKKNAAFVGQKKMKDLHITNSYGENRYGHDW